MRVVQALYWLKDTLATDRDRILSRLAQVLVDPAHGPAICQDLLDGFGVLPAWMQSLVRELPGCNPLPTAMETNAYSSQKPSTRRRPVNHVETSR